MFGVLLKWVSCKGVLDLCTSGFLVVVLLILPGGIVDHLTLHLDVVLRAPKVSYLWMSERGVV